MIHWLLFYGTPHFSHAGSLDRCFEGSSPSVIRCKGALWEGTGEKAKECGQVSYTVLHGSLSLSLPPPSLLSSLLISSSVHLLYVCICCIYRFYLILYRLQKSGLLVQNIIEVSCILITIISSHKKLIIIKFGTLLYFDNFMWLSLKMFFFLLNN